MSGLYSTKRWRERREHQLRRHPLCQWCEREGRLTAATVADHIERHGGDPAKFFTGALQSLCKPHHDSQKQSMEKGGQRHLAACGPDGLPISPEHPWNRPQG